MRTRLLLLATAASCLLAAPALSYTPQIDFRDVGIWGGAYDQASYSESQNGVDITLNARPDGARLYWDSMDGIGVQYRYSYEYDEIEAGERLEVVFGGETRLSAIYVSDLYIEDGYVETGYYRIRDGTWHEWVMFDATLPGTGENGEHVIAFDPAVLVTAIKFRAPGVTNGRENHEFSLLGLDAARAAAPMPEPSSVALFCVGGLTVSAALRRRRSASA